MIYEFILGRLDQVDALQERNFPVAVVIDEFPPPLSVYRWHQREYVKDLSGNVHHVIDVLDITILDQDYDRLCEIGDQVIDALSNVSNLDTGAGEYVFSCICSMPEPDGFDPTMELMTRVVECEIRWCELES